MCLFFFEDSHWSQINLHHETKAKTASVGSGVRLQGEHWLPYLLKMWLRKVPSSSCISVCSCVNKTDYAELFWTLNKVKHKSCLAQDLAHIISVNVNDEDDDKNPQGACLGRKCWSSLGILWSLASWKGTGSRQIRPEQVNVQQCLSTSFF